MSYRSVGAAYVYAGQQNKRFDASFADGSTGVICGIDIKDATCEAQVIAKRRKTTLVSISIGF